MYEMPAWEVSDEDKTRNSQLQIESGLLRLTFWSFSMLDASITFKVLHFKLLWALSQ